MMTDRKLNTREEADARWCEIEQRAQHYHDVDKHRTSRSVPALVEDVARTNSHDEIREGKPAEHCHVVHHHSHDVHKCEHYKDLK